METRLNKEEFILECIEKIDIHNFILHDIYENIVIDIINKFKNRVCNKRFTDAISEKISEVCDDIYVTTELGNNLYTQTVQLNIFKRYKQERIDLYIDVEILNNNRIVGIWDKSKTIDCFKENITNLEKSIDMYDSAIDLFQQIEDLCIKLEHIPYNLRHNVIRMNTLYLPKN